MGKTSIPGKRRIRELYDLRGILNAVWNRLRFTVTGSGAEHLTINQTGGVVTVDFDTEGLGGGVPEDIAIEDVDGLGDALAGKAATSHSHATSDVTGLDSALAGKAATSHTHATSEVTGLDAALAGKAATSHTHPTSEVTGLDAALAGKAASSHTHATSEVTGLDAALAGKAATSHSHATSDVTGLDAALAGKASTSHSHATSDVTGLDAALAGKAAASHTHATSEVTGLDAALAGKAAASHTHATSEVTGLDAALAGKAAASHTHATSEVTGLDAALAGKAASSHTHNASDINAGTLDAARIPVAGTTTIGGVKRNAGAAGQFITGFNTDGTAMYDEPASLEYRPGTNLLINGQFRISQRGATFTGTGGGNNDGVYTLDRWVLLSDGNDVVDLETKNLFLGSGPSRYVLDLDVQTANKKFGVLQILEQSQSRIAYDTTVTLSFRAGFNSSTTLTKLKAAILSWSGTADAVTRDVVSSWNSGGTNPTLAANWSYLNTPSDLGAVGEMNKFSVSANAGTNQNLAVLIWADGADGTVGNSLYVADVQLELGDVATEFEAEFVGTSLAKCQRYYEVARYNEDNLGAYSSFYYGTTYNHHWYYKATKRIKPVVTLATGSWAGGAPTINEGIDSTYLTRVGAFFASGTSGNVCLAADAEL